MKHGARREATRITVFAKTSNQFTGRHTPLIVTVSLYFKETVFSEACQLSNGQGPFFLLGE